MPDSLSPGGSTIRPGVDDWVAEVQRLKADFLRTSLERLRDLDRDLDHLTRDRTDQDRMRTVHRGFHRLAGTGTTFGYPDVSEMARAAESLVWQHLKSGHHLSLEDLQRLVYAGAAIRRELEGRG